MPVSIACPACGARLKLPDGTPTRRFRCPKCQAPFLLPVESGQPADFAFGTDAEGAPTPHPGRRPTLKRTAPGYNPFSDTPEDEVPDPAGEGFEFGVEAPPPAPAGEFDFGPVDPRGDDGPHRRGR